MDFVSKCNQIRKDILLEIGTLGVGHIGGSLSIVELLVVLYYKHMNVEPSNPQKEGRDRLIVSKGHSGPTTGSLGQGFSCAVGIAKASMMRKDNATIYAVIGDGESQEGQIWEAAMFAGAHKLSNLIAFTDNNKLQLDGKVSDICSIEPLDKKWESFGWNVINVENGNDCESIDKAIVEAKQSELPTMVILNTVKGNGIKFAEEAGTSNHSMPVTQEMFEKAMKELGGEE